MSFFQSANSSPFFSHYSAFWDEEKVPEGARNCRYIVDLNIHENPLDMAAEGEPVPLHFINFNKLRSVPVLAAVLHGRRAERMVRHSLFFETCAMCAYMAHAEPILYFIRNRSQRRLERWWHSCVDL